MENIDNDDEDGFVMNIQTTSNLNSKSINLFNKKKEKKEKY
jgi:hypothetical protein